MRLFPSDSSVSWHGRFGMTVLWLFIVVVVVDSGFSFEGFNINHPETAGSFSKSLDVSADGTSNAPGDVVTVRMKDKDDVVQSNFNYTVGMMTDTWVGTLTKPSGGWDFNKNPFTCELLSGGTSRDTNTGINFSQQ